jgi:hypothetical protein
LLKYLERRLKQLGFFKFKIVTIKKGIANLATGDLEIQIIKLIKINIFSTKLFMLKKFSNINF